MERAFFASYPHQPANLLYTYRCAFFAGAPHVCFAQLHVFPRGVHGRNPARHMAYFGTTKWRGTATRKMNADRLWSSLAKFMHVLHASLRVFVPTLHQ